MNGSLTINGKFTAQRLTGVQRVAEQLVRALDARPGAAGVTLLMPPRGRSLGLQRIREVRVGPAGWPLHAWEQLALPWLARGSLLLNLAGGAPAWGARQVCLLHDAAVFDHPEAYTPMFVRWYRWLFHRLARRSEAVLTVSRFSQARLAQALGVRAADITVVRNGVDPVHAQALPAEAVARHLARWSLLPGRYLLAVGSVNPNKNLGRLLQAHARLPAGRLPLAVAGGVDPRVFAGSVAVEQEGVVRLGAVDDDALRALYQGARALVFPSLYEGFGLPPLEAMAAGCAVVASTAASLPEVCGDAALGVDPRDVAALTHAMHQICTDDALHARLVDAGRAQAARFRWDESAQVLASVLARSGVTV